MKYTVKIENYMRNAPKEKISYYEIKGVFEAFFLKLIETLNLYHAFEIFVVILGFVL